MSRNLSVLYFAFVLLLPVPSIACFALGFAANEPLSALQPVYATFLFQQIPSSCAVSYFEQSVISHVKNLVTGVTKGFQVCAIWTALLTMFCGLIQKMLLASSPFVYSTCIIAAYIIIFQYKMKFVYAHFPINYNVTDGPTGKNTILEIRNFIGEKLTRRITMQKGCIVERTANKDEIAITGNDLDAVSISAAQVPLILCLAELTVRSSHYLAGSAIFHRQEPRFA